MAEAENPVAVDARTESDTETRHEKNRQLYEGEESVTYWSEQTGLMPVEGLVFGRHLRKDMDILDLGVGGGRTTPYLSELANKYVGLDYAEGMVEACRRRFPELTFHHADAADLSPFGDTSFDAVVFSFGGIDYLTPPAKRERCLAECRRVLRPGGVLIISRHNPRAIVRLPGRHGQAGSPVSPLKAVVAVPLWAVRRSVRMVPTRAFWQGDGMIEQPAHGFNSPVLPWSRSQRAARGKEGIFTEMATPRRVREELQRCGFDPVQTEGAAYPKSAFPLTTNWYYYAAIKR
jgi:SAM-dependent methyltransferase